MRSSTREALVTAVTVLLFALLLFLQPRLVGALKGSYKRDTKHCNGKGMIRSDNTCNCYSGYRGANCTLRYCPFGKSWATMPTADHVRNRPNVECSNMGLCDIHSGTCTCRDGFEGRACERLSCPTSVAGSTCSGHGRCLTMSEAGSEFNGFSLVRPPVDYTGWDADSMQGCVCDYGYSGYDCSRRTCPYGIDPLSSGTPVLEKLTLVCQASSGYFNIQIFGYSTPAIKYDFGPAALKHVLESIPGMGTVTVETATKPGTGRANVCGASYLSETSITLNSYVGPAPPRMYVTSGSSSNSRLSTRGSTSLAGTGMELYMQTSFTLTCPVCAGCDAGVIWFALGDSISDEVLLHTPYTSAAAVISSAIAGIEDLANGGWENLEVSVTANDDDASVCKGGATNSFTVNIKSSYGNLPYIELVGGAWREHEQISLTWESDNFQDGDPLQCSGQGYCNITSGRCECTRFYESSKLQFEMQSSDGQGSPGTRGDCGHYKRTKLSSVSAACQKETNATNGDRTLCSGHGECISALSDACTCYSGWSGILCDIAISCPSGPAWFDEPLSSTVAHQSAVCSNMGHCDDSTGRCQCREGFHGAACQYMDCPRDSDGRPCSGKGWCMNMNKWGEIAGFEYGDESNPRIEPGAWDAFGFHACMCSAGHPTPYSLSGASNTLYPTVGPMTTLNGLPTETPGLPGWRGYNCQERNCPSGNRIVSPATNSAATAVFEEQIVGCTGDNSTNSSFTLSFYGHETTLITGDMGSADIKAAIEWPPTIGNVTISFLNGLDNSTACHRSYDANQGFVVRFDTELGNLPLLQEVSSENAILNISQRVAGTLTSEECGGIESGVCDRSTGTCMCHGRFRSSGGTNTIGIRGDCGHYFEGVVDFTYT